MKRHSDWMDKPVTWGAYFKFAGICTVIGAVIGAIECVLWMEPAWWQATKNFAKRLFKR